MAAPDNNHYPHLGSGDVIGLIGLAALAFVAGRATAPHSDCPDRLHERTQELLLVYARQTGAPGLGITPPGLL